MVNESDKYKTIKSTSEGFYKDKGSKFYAYAYPVRDEAEIKEYQDILRKKHHDARHHVYAFVIGPDKSFYRASDDGEPAHSSGDPVLGQIRSKDLTNILIVVVRYFGGTKLGIPGLINAYKSAAADAISNAKIIDKYLTKELRIHFDYNMMDQVNKIINVNKLEVTDRDFKMDCKMGMEVLLSDVDRIVDIIESTNGIEILDVK